MANGVMGHLRPIGGKKCGRGRAPLSRCGPTREGWENEVEAVGAAPREDVVGYQSPPRDAACDGFAVLELPVVGDRG
jgi:hypothetical protein